MKTVYEVVSRKDDEVENMLTLQQFNYIWEDSSRHYKMARAEEQAKRFTRQFNKKFGTDYEWNQLYCIDEYEEDSDGWRI